MFKIYLSFLLFLPLLGCTMHAPGKGLAHDTTEHPSHSVHSAHHRFIDAERWAKVFESEDREAWQKPEGVLDELQLRSNMLVADIGSGTGYFAVRFAKRVERVWAVDLEESMATYVQNRAKREGIQNITPVVAEVDSPKLPTPVDLVFLCDTYHHIENRTSYFRALSGKLRQGARLVVVDFKLGEIPVGPPERHRISPHQVIDEMKKAGYSLLDLDEKTLPYQYIAQFSWAGDR